jgi:hypothetical protein
MFLKIFNRMSYIEAFLKIWINQLVSSRAQGDMIHLYSTVFSVSGGKSLGKRKAHLTALLKELGVGFHLPQLPDVSEFGIVLGLVNPLLLAFGLVGRYGAEIKLRRYRNRRMNKYLLHVFTVMVQLLKAGQKERFWKLFTIVMQKSSVYLVYCSWKIDKNLYRNLKARALKKIFREVHQLRTNWSTEMVFHRTYIPKGETHRPLGVPSLPWRIYTNMLLHPLLLAHPLPSSQHGFKPGAGTLTAWIVMLKEVLLSPNIYEGDLRQCFPSVNLLRLAVILIKQGMPSWIAGLYIFINQVSPEFKGAILLNENQFLLREQYKDLLKQDPSRVPLNPDYPLFAYSDETWLKDQILKNAEEALGIHGEVLLTFLESSKDQLQYELIKEGLLHIFNEFVDKTPIEEYVHYADFLKWIGTAQGSPLSPVLSAIALSEIPNRLPENVKVLFYADDFILYGSGLNPETLALSKEVFREYGFTIHEDKSRWFKLNNTLLHEEIKFLGISFNAITNVLRSSTRKGANLIMSKQELLSFEYDKNYALSHSSPFLFSLWGKFMSLSKLPTILLASMGFTRSLTTSYAKYLKHLAYFRRWFYTELQWDLLALFRTLYFSPAWLIRRFLTLGMYRLEDLSSAKEFALRLYPEEKAISTIVDKSDTTDLSQVGLKDNEVAKALNYVNPYLRAYRSKYTFVNFCASRFKGLLLARMYSGSWIQSVPLQNFRLTFSKMSLAQTMKLYCEYNIFNGSSIALNILIKTTRSCSKTKRWSQRWNFVLYSTAENLLTDRLLWND